VDGGYLISCCKQGRAIGYEDVHTKIDLCRAHYEKVGLGAKYVDQFIRYRQARGTKRSIHVSAHPPVSNHESRGGCDAKSSALS
jgi:hypothetical protein